MAESPDAEDLVPLDPATGLKRGDRDLTVNESADAIAAPPVGVFAENLSMFGLSGDLIGVLALGVAEQTVLPHGTDPRGAREDPRIT